MFFLVASAAVDSHYLRHRRRPPPRAARRSPSSPFRAPDRQRFLLLRFLLSFFARCVHFMCVSVPKARGTSMSDRPTGENKLHTKTKDNVIRTIALAAPRWPACARLSSFLPLSFFSGSPLTQCIALLHLPESDAMLRSCDSLEPSHRDGGKRKKEIFFDISQRFRSSQSNWRAEHLLPVLSARAGERDLRGGLHSAAASKIVLNSLDFSSNC